MIEQITFLIFVRLLDVNEARDENRLKRSGAEFKRRFNADEQELRWSQFRHLGADEMLPLVRDRVFPHFRKAGIPKLTRRRAKKILSTKLWNSRTYVANVVTAE